MAGKSPYPGGTQRHSVRLPPVIAEYLRQIGGGSIATGVILSATIDARAQKGRLPKARAVVELMQREDTTPAIKRGPVK